MEVEALKQECRNAIERGGEAVVLVVPRGNCLCGNWGPRGELLCENANGERVLRFKAKRILQFLQREEAKHTIQLSEDGSSTQ